jgi:hypothetical protein
MNPQEHPKDCIEESQYQLAACNPENLVTMALAPSEPGDGRSEMRRVDYAARSILRMSVHSISFSIPMDLNYLKMRSSGL